MWKKHTKMQHSLILWTLPRQQWQISNEKANKVPLSAAAIKLLPSASLCSVHLLICGGLLFQQWQDGWGCFMLPHRPQLFSYSSSFCCIDDSQGVEEAGLLFVFQGWLWVSVQKPFKNNKVFFFVTLKKKIFTNQKKCPNCAQRVAEMTRQAFKACVYKSSVAVGQKRQSVGAAPPSARRFPDRTTRERRTSCLKKRRVKNLACFRVR